MVGHNGHTRWNRDTWEVRAIRMGPVGYLLVLMECHLVTS